MHNRDMIWTTKEGEKIKIRDLTSAHLSNLLPFIDQHIIAYKFKFGDKKLKKIKFNIKQEIRYRKLNRINKNNEEDKLF